MEDLKIRHIKDAFERRAGEMNYQIVNEKNIDEIKDKNPPSKSFIEAHRHYCKNCNDKICCNKGKDKWAYCAGGEE